MLMLDCIEHQLLTLPHLLLLVAEGKHIVLLRVWKKDIPKMSIFGRFRDSWASAMYLELALYGSLAIVLYASLTVSNITAILTSGLVHPYLLLPSNSTSASQISRTVLRAYFRLASRSALL